MKEKLEKQIDEIAKLSDKTIQLFGLNAPALVEQKKTIPDLVECLRAEVAQLDFAFFDQIMRDEEYDTEIQYDSWTRRKCNHILMLGDEETLPVRFDRTIVYLKKRTDGTMEVWWYQNGEKKGIHNKDVNKANQIINVFKNHHDKVITRSTEKDLFDKVQELSGYREREQVYASLTISSIPKPIERLKDFFDSQKYTAEEKEKIEKILIFSVFLQAMWDLFTELNKTELTDKQLLYSATEALSNYFDILDNIAYKCNPDAYKRLSFLSLLPISLGSSFAAMLACMVLFSPLFIGVWAIVHWNMLFLIAPATIAGFVFLGSLTLLVQNYIGPTLFLDAYDHPTDRIPACWNLNWAYRLPERALEGHEWGLPVSPKDIGISAPLFFPPNFLRFGFNIRAASPGASFKAMNRSGFFSFKETAVKATEVADTVEKSLGSMLVKTPS